MTKRVPFGEWKAAHEARLAEARAAAFECAVCERTIVPEIHQMRGNGYGRDGHVKPLCRACEQMHNGAGVSRIYHGAFMDRRIVTQIGSLAEEIVGEANRKEWSVQYAKGASRVARL